MYVSASKKVHNFFNKYKPLYYKKGETIIRASDNPHGVNYVIDGYVRLYSLSKEGMEFTLNIFKPGSYFPVMWAIGGENNRYYYEAMTPTQIRRAPRKELIFFIRKDPSVLYELTKRLVSGLGGLIVRMEDLILGDARQKVGATLYVLAKRFGKKEGGKKIIITLPITHQGIAGLAGLSRETTSLEMKKFEREGIISRQKRFIVINKMRKLKISSSAHAEGGQLPYSL